jgi:hypothetical protein
VSLDVLENTIHGKNEAPRHTSQTDEKRPYHNSQATLVGHLGRNLEWGVDGRDWRSNSEESWFFSASAGIGSDPLAGRGKLLQREERGRALRSRLRWTYGPIQLGGGVTTGYRRIIVTPPGLDDLTSFNYFRNTTVYRANADSIALPDSVVYNRSDERTWDAGGGLAVRLPGGRGLLAVEYHRLRDLLEQTAAGAGPLGRSWDLRTGLEYKCSPIVTGRVGYVYRKDDRDSFTKQNEYLGNTVTLGLGLRPVGANWTVEAGYAVEWLQADFGLTTEPHASRQQLASMLRWAF